MIVSEIYERMEGVYVHIREDHHSCSVCVTGFLQEPATEKLKNSQSSRLILISEQVKKAVNLLMQRCGSLKAFLHHARMLMWCVNSTSPIRLIVKYF